MQRVLRWARAYRLIRHRLFSLFVMLSVVPLSVWQAAAQTEALDNQHQIVHGTVTNAITHNPIGRALVFSTDNRYATLTDSEGHFEFALPGGLSAAGSFAWLTARKPGFLDDPGARAQVEVSPGTEVAISLLPEGVIQGRITFSATEPATGVTVQIFSRQVTEGMPRWVPRNVERTNSNGEFRFAELLPGAYKLVTHEWMDAETMVPGGQPYGFPPVYYPGAGDFVSASAIQLTAGQTFHANISLVGQPYYSVKIPVVIPEPNFGPNISVSPQGQRSPGYSLGYNREKQTIEGQLPNGKYLVEAEIFGQNSSATGAVNLAVAGGPAEGAGMVFAPNISIPVNVKEEFTAAEWNATGTWNSRGKTFSTPKLRLDLDLRAENADDFAQRRDGSLREPTGPNDNSMVLENLAPGRYWLRIHAQRGYVASATMGGVDLLREPLVVVPGASTEIDITLRDDSAEIEGTLLGISSGTSSGAPFGSAAPNSPVDSGRRSPSGYVYCVPSPESSGQFLEISASREGAFAYRMVTPGNYRVLAFKNPQRDLPYRDADAMKVYETKGRVVHFSRGQKVSLQLEVISRAE